MGDSERISIKELKTAIERFVRARVSPDETEDIVASTIARIWELDLQRRAKALSSMKADSSELEMPRTEALKLSYTIARGQVAHHYRSSAQRLTVNCLSPDEDRAVDDRADLYRLNVTAQLVRELVVILARFSDMQNEALTDYLLGIQGGPQSPVQRKLISRLRAEIKSALVSKFGEDVLEYLNEE